MSLQASFWHSPLGRVSGERQRVTADLMLPLVSVLGLGVSWLLI